MTDPTQRFRPLFDDVDAGLYTLPPDIIEARAAVDRIDGELASHDAGRVDEEAVRQDVLAKFRAAAFAGKAWPDVAPMRKAAQANADHDARRRILADAHGQVASELVNRITDSAEQIIADCLRPRHAEAVERFAAAAAVVPEHPSTDQLLKADDKTRRMWLGLADAAHAYGRITAAATTLNQLGTLEHDLGGEFSYCRNIREVWPMYAPGRTPPWPQDDQRLALLALVRLGADLWLPTLRDRADAWLAAHGEKVQRQRQVAQQAQALASVIGS